MKMSKATTQEIEDMHELARLIDSVCHPRNFENACFPNDEIEEPFDEDKAEDLHKFYERVKRLSSGIFRVVYGYEVLLDNCCDPTKNVLEFKPEIAEQAQIIERMGEKIKELTGQLEALENRLYRVNEGHPFPTPDN